MNTATGDLVLIVTGFLALLCFLGWLAETVGPDPFKGERRRDWQ